MKMQLDVSIKRDHWHQSPKSIKLYINNAIAPSGGLSNYEIISVYVSCNVFPGASFMNRRRLCQLTAAILTSDLTTRMWVL